MSSKNPRVENGPSTRPLAWDAIVLGLLLAGALVLSYQVRIRQYEAWQAKPERYFAGGLPLVTSLDGFYWLRLAEDRRNGTAYRDGHDPLRSYPDGAPYVRPIPLLSLLLSLAASAFGTNAFQAGIYLVPTLSGLFIVPLALYCRRVGLHGAGLLGGLVACFSEEYFTRTSIGGVDTDVLILFFLFLGSYLVLLAAQAKTERSIVVYAAGAGVVMLLFYWWYYHAGFTVVYLGLLLLMLALRRPGWRTLLAAAAAYSIAANPLLLWKGAGGVVRFASEYVFGARDSVAEATYLPSVLWTVAEFQREPLMPTLALVLEPPLLALLGLVLVGFAAYRRARLLLPLLPVLVLGLLALVSGRRFAMFVAPFVGIGYGHLLAALLRRPLERARVGRPARRVVLYGAALALFALLSRGLPTGFLPAPTLSSSTVSTVLELERRLPEHAVVLSWWDYGYALTGLGRFATYHDGSYHRVNTFLIARALSSVSQEKLYGTAALINRHGATRIVELLEQDAAPARRLTEAGEHEGSIDRGDVHLLLLEPMIAKYGAIHYLGTWDVQRGTGAPDGYQRLDCRNWTDDRIHCGDMVIDIKTGHIRENLDLQHLVFIRNGRMAEVFDFPNPTGVYLQVLANDDGVFAFYLLDDRVFRSNFNQLYFLGRPDPALFEEVYSDFPTARVYRLKPR